MENIEDRKPATGLAGWGPQRDTFLMKTPAPYVSFNSISDNPNVGDERNFVRVKLAGTENKYTNDVKVKPGDVIEGWVYYHNNAAANLNATGKGVALGTRVKCLYDKVVENDEYGRISAFLSCVNAEPTEIWDGAKYYSDEPINVRYEKGSATIHNADVVLNVGRDIKLPENDLFGEGVLIGAMIDGIIPGCSEYSGCITFRLIVESKNK